MKDQKAKVNSPHVSRKTICFYCCAVVLIGAAAYSNSFWGVFVFDDTPNIVENKTIRSFDSMWHVEKQKDLAGLRNRPVVRFSLVVNFATGQLNTVGYHLWNLVVHLTAGLFLFGVVRRTLLLDGVPRRLVKNAPHLAFAVAAIWVAHPLQTQSVTYVIQRCESMMGMFYLGALYCLIRGAQSQYARSWYTGAILLCWLGFGCKEVMITAPAVLLLYDRIFLAQSFGDILRLRWWVYAGLSVAAIWLLFNIATAPADTNSVVRDALEMQRPTRWGFMRTQPAVILHYLRLCIWPYPQCLDYWWPVAQWPGEVVLSGVIVLGMVCASVWMLFQRPRIAFLALSFFILLSPSSSIIPLHVAFEHRMYLPLAAVCTGIVILASDVLLLLKIRGTFSPKRLPLVATALVFVLTATFGSLTFLRNQIYHSPIRVWTDVLQTANHNPRAHTNLGIGYYNRFRISEVKDDADLEKAIHHYETALELNPKLPNANFNLGLIRHRQKRFKEAIEHFETTIESNPKFMLAYFNIGAYYVDNGQKEKAIKYLKKAVEISPDNPFAHYRLGLALEPTEPVEAMKEFNKAIKLSPNYVEPSEKLVNWHFKEGKELSKTDDLRTAIGHFTRVTKLVPNPHQAEAHYELGVLFGRMGNADMAKKHLFAALSIDNEFEAARRAYQSLNNGPPVSPQQPK